MFTLLTSFMFYFAGGLNLFAQKALTYQLPPQEMIDIVDASTTPTVQFAPGNDFLAILSRSGLPTIADLSREELRIAGLRIDPSINGGSRLRYYTGIKFMDRITLKVSNVTGLPTHPKIIEVHWSPNGEHLAFIIVEPTGLSLWMVSPDNTLAKRITKPELNGIFRGGIYTWTPDSESLVYLSVLSDRGPVPVESKVPTGPVVQENIGKKAAVRTYEDMLKNPYDEQLFAYFATSQMRKYSLNDSFKTIGTPGMIISLSPSPDGQYLLVQKIHKPFSYLVPYYRFPLGVEIWNSKGEKIRTIAEVPLAENIPKGFDAVRKGPRSFSWRADVPAMVYWAEAQDGGNPHKEAAIRDQVFSLAAPFDKEPVKGIGTTLRYSGITWGNGSLAVLNERWRKSRKNKISFFAPDKPVAEGKVIFENSTEDRYNNPGNFVTTNNASGKRILLIGKKGKCLYLFGQGASSAGNQPFVDQFDLKNQKSKRLWRSEAPYYENPVLFIDPAKGILITSRQSVSNPPNYFSRSLKSGKFTPITHFPNPYEKFKYIKKQVVKYQRDDGVQLSFELYLPKGYKKENGPLPTFLWAYPREFKSAAAAGQINGSPYSFPRLSPLSALVMVTQGYAVLNNASFPIIGEGDQEPNDTFVKQLVANARAAINKAVEMGLTDPKRVAVGGHSYGAFMTANLLAHSNLFAAGIARSGAYNRTLTPFGFQNESRTYWEAPEIYYAMSPFMHADEVKAPLLLIHGIADNNSGTFPIQSERFYAALKGNGTTTRLVMLPRESHGYRGRESVLHMLWEMTEWLDKYVKDKE